MRFIFNKSKKRGMKHDKEHYATNLHPGCDEKDCYTCPYFDYKGRCHFDEKVKDCDYCSTAFTDERLDPETDFQSIPVGDCNEGFSVYLDTGVANHPPISIKVYMWRDDLRQNITVATFTPHFCPMCGRKIVENEPFLKKSQR